MENELRGKIIITANGQDQDFEQTAMGVNMDSNEAEILAAVQGVIRETLTDDHGEFAYTVRKSINTGCIHVYPKPVAG